MYLFRFLLFILKIYQEVLETVHAVVKKHEAELIKKPLLQASRHLSMAEKENINKYNKEDIERDEDYEIKKQKYKHSREREREREREKSERKTSRVPSKEKYAEKRTERVREKEEMESPVQHRRGKSTDRLTRKMIPSSPSGIMISNLCVDGELPLGLM